MTWLRHLPFIGDYLDERSYQKLRIKLDAEMARQRELDATDPVSFVDDYLGVFKYSRGISGGNFQLTREWGRKNLRLIIQFSDGTPDANKIVAAELATRARVFWENQSDWDRKFKACILEDFLPDLLDDLPEGSPPTDEQEMLSRMKVSEIRMQSSGYFEVSVYIHDVRTFHYIDVCGSVFGGELVAEFYD